MRALDNEIRTLHVRYWDNELQTARGKHVLLVEGDDDRLVVEALLDRRRATWATRARVVVAGGRAAVLQRGQTLFPHAQMLVDRDTWTDAEIPALPDGRLHVTAGWCLENLFLDPYFLRSFDLNLADTVAAGREPWVRAGAFWWTVQRAREAQQSWQEALGWTYGTPRDDLDLQSGDTLRATLAAKVPAPVRDESRLDIDALAETFERRLRTIIALPEPEQWQRGVHGKEAFRRLLVPALPSHRNWRIELAQRLDNPPPFDALLALLLA